MRHERERLFRQLVSDDDRGRQGFVAHLDPVVVFREHRGDRLPFQHLVARLHRDDESDGGIDRVLHRAPPPAEGDDRATDGARLDALHHPRAWRGIDLHRLSLWQDRGIFNRFRVAALGLDDLLELLRREPRGDRRLEFLAGFLRVLLDARLQQHLDAECVRHLEQISRSLAAERQDCLFCLEDIAAGAPQGPIHGGDQGDSRAAAVLTERDHGLRELEAALYLGQKRAAAVFHVEHQAVQPFSQLLRHDARCNQRNRLDGRRHVAQRVQLAIGRSDLRGLTDERATQFLHLRLRFGEREIGAKTGNRFELVERAAGVAQPASRHHRNGDAAGGDQGREHEGDFVADTAGRVLVDAGRRPPIERKALPRRQHCIGQRRQLLAPESAQTDAHQHRRDLIIGDPIRGVLRHERGPFLGTQRRAIALALDQRPHDHWLMRLSFCLLAPLICGSLAAQSVAQHIAEGDSAGLMHPDVQLRHYQAALAIDSLSYEANWKAARAIADVAKQIQGNADSLKLRRDSLYAVGRTYAERAIRADSTQADGHYALAMVLGRLSRTKGSKERVRYAKIIYDEATRAVQINPNHNFAHHVLGAWNAEVERLGSFQRFFAKTLFGGGFW